jgi:hypothetical protein
MRKTVLTIAVIVVILAGAAVYWNHRPSIVQVAPPVQTSTPASAVSVLPEPNTSFSSAPITTEILPTPKIEPVKKYAPEKLPSKPAAEVRPATATTSAYSQTVSTVPLEERLLSADPKISQPAQTEIPNLSNDEKTKLAFSILNTVKNVGDPVLQTSAAEKATPVLIHLGPPAFPALIKGLGDSVPVIRMKSAYALGSFGAFAKEALPPLIKNAGHDSDVFARCDAIDAIGKMGPVADDAVATLVTALGDPNKLVRFHAVEAVGDIGPKAAHAIPILTSILSGDRDLYTRGSAAKSLGQMGELAAMSVPELSAAAKESDPRLSQLSTAALKKIKK